MAEIPLVDKDPKRDHDLLRLGNTEWKLSLHPDEIRDKISRIYEGHGNVYKGTYDPKIDKQCGPISDDVSEFLRSREIPAETVGRHYEFWDSEGNFIADGWDHAYVDSNVDGVHHIIDATYLQFLRPEEKEKFPHVLMVAYKTKSELQDALSTLPFENPGITLPLYLGFMDTPVMIEDAEALPQSDRVCKVILPA